MLNHLVKKLTLILLLSAISLTYACVGSENSRDSGDSNAAVSSSSIRSAYDVDPNNQRFRMLLGRYYVITKQFEKAVEDDKSPKSNWDDAFTYLLRKNKPDMEASIGLADAYIKWGDSLSRINPTEQKEKYQEAGILIEKQMGMHESNSKLMFELCRIYTRVNDEKSFYRTYSEAVNEDPDLKTIEDHTAGEIAEFFINKGSHARAKEILVKMSERGSREPKVHYELSRVHYAQDRMDESFQDLVRAMDYSHVYDLDSANTGSVNYASNELKSQIMNDLGKIRMELNDDPEKEEEAKEFTRYHMLMSVKYDNNNSNSFSSLGNMYYQDLTEPGKAEKIDKAILYYVKAASVSTGYELSETTSGAVDSIISRSIEKNDFKMPESTNKVINQSVKEILHHTGMMENNVESEIFYKIGYLYYEKARAYREELGKEDYMTGNLRELLEAKFGDDLGEVQLKEILEDDNYRNEFIESTNDEIDELEVIARNSFFMAFGKGDSLLRENPNLNFALGNSYYYEGKFELAVNHYENMISYLESYLQTKYMTKPNTDPKKARINADLSQAYNNLGSARYMLYINTGDFEYFKKARTDFLIAQDYYVKNEKSMNSPKMANLRDLFDHKKMNLSDSLISTYRPSVYEGININIHDIIK